MSLREKIKLSALGVGAPVPAASFDCQCDPLAKLRIGCNLEISMSSGRDAFLGHACVSPAAVRDELEHGGLSGCAQNSGVVQ